MPQGPKCDSDLHRRSVCACDRQADGRPDGRRERERGREAGRARQGETKSEREKHREREHILQMLDVSRKPPCTAH